MEREGIVTETEIKKAYDEYLRKNLDIIFNSGKNNKKNTMAWPYIKRRCVGERVFNEGIAKFTLKDSDDCVYINPNNELIGGRFFKTSEEDFHFGLKLVEKDGKYNYINKNGKLISDNWHRVAYNFHGDYAIVADDKFYFINRKGEKVSDEYDSIDEEVTGGLYKAYNDYIKYNSYGGYYFLKPNGAPINDEVYDWAYKFFYGYCQVLKNNKIGYINQKGELYNGEFISKNKANNSKTEVPKIEYGFISKMVDGIALANFEKNHELYWVYIDKDGNPLFDKEFTYANYFNEGFAEVSDGGYSNYIIRKDGKELLRNNDIRVNEFKNGFALVKRDGLDNYIDAEGRFIRKKPVYIGENFGAPYDRFAKVHFDRKGTVNFIDGNGNFVLKDNIEEKGFTASISEISKNFVRVWYSFMIEKASKLYYDQYFDKYEVFKSKNEYKCVLKGTKGRFTEFIVKYEPVAIYDEYILCLKNKTLYIFDVKRKKYTELGEIDEIEYDENFIFDGNTNKMYFMYSGMMIDVTDYYEEQLLFRKSYGVKKNIRLYTYEVFRDNYIKKIASKIADELLGDTEVEKVPERSFDELKEENKSLVEEMEKSIQEDELTEIVSGNISDEVLKLKLDKLDEYEKKFGKIERIRVKNIFNNYGIYKEIKPIYFKKNLLSRIDLSNQDFKNAKISGVDFRGCNIFFNPQEIYGKDLSNCNLEGMYIPPFMDFTGVNLKGTKFSSDNDPYTKDYGSSFFPLSIYDETTTFDGIPFTVKYGECQYQSDNKERRV